MSMTSVQVDRLRDTATRVEIFLVGCTDAIPMDTHEQLREAADTICKIQDENVKLRKLIGAYHEYCLCNQYSKKSAHQLITEIDDMICELGIEVDG